MTLHNPSDPNDPSSRKRKPRDGERQAYRILNLVSYLLDCPNGATRNELADYFNVHRSTISRDLAKLPNKSEIYEGPDGRLHVDRSRYLVNTSFTLHEVMALYLATRLLATRMDRRNLHAASALRKLSGAVEKLAPSISHQIDLSSKSLGSKDQWEDPLYIQALETLTQALADGKKVRLWHVNEKSGDVHEYTFSPYFIEPYAIGQSTHVVGAKEPDGKLRTFKIERIEKVELISEHYSLPVDFSPQELLEDAWGIWFTEEEPVEVVLRFGPEVVNRVRESRWHRSQEIRELDNGFLEWRAKVSTWKEMLPWIRGWGAGVEVLAPSDLREEIAADARRLAELYK
jgi:CRISPR-associated endonuclease/helicase Cas3